MPVAKEQIRQIITENNIKSVSDIHSLLKDSVVLGMTTDGYKGILSIAVGGMKRQSSGWAFLMI